MDIDEFREEQCEIDAIDELMEEAYIESMESQGYEKCTRCEEWVDDSYIGICRECIEKIIKNTDYDTALTYAIANADEYEFLTEMFSKTEIADILKSEIARTLKISKNAFDGRIVEYLNTDELHFIDYLQDKGEI